MKKFLGLIILIQFGFMANAQMPSPVNWEFEAKHLEGSIYELHFKANIDGDWNIYSQYIEDGGPVATNFEYKLGDHFELVDKNMEKGKKKEGFDALFDMDVIKFAHHVDFIQKINVLDSNLPVAGQVEFMVCNDESCLPPKLVEFNFTLPTSK